MRKQIMTLLGGALVFSLSLAPVTFAGLHLNGPDLTGTRIDRGNFTTHVRVPTPTQATLSNGPDLTGIRVEDLTGDSASGDRGVNGPDLTGTGIQLHHSVPGGQDVTIPLHPLTKPDTHLETE